MIEAIKEKLLMTVFYNYFTNYLHIFALHFTSFFKILVPTFPIDEYHMSN